MDQVEPILQFFAYSHLPEKLQTVSKPFGELAERIYLQLPRNPERSVALRKLLEAKDAAVRAFIFKEHATMKDPSHVGGETKTEIGVSKYLTKDDPKGD